MELLYRISHNVVVCGLADSSGIQCLARNDDTATGEILCNHFDGLIRGCRPRTHVEPSSAEQAGWYKNFSRYCITERFKFVDAIAGAVPVVEQVVYSKADMNKLMKEGEQLPTFRVGCIDENQRGKCIYNGESTKLIDIQRSMGVVANDAVHHDNNTGITHFGSEMIEGCACTRFKPVVG